MFGFSATLSMVGFAWGVWKGFLLGSVAALTGSAIAFYSVRVSVSCASRRDLVS